MNQPPSYKLGSNAIEVIDRHTLNVLSASTVVVDGFVAITEEKLLHEVDADEEAVSRSLIRLVTSGVIHFMGVADHDESLLLFVILEPEAKLEEGTEATCGGR